MNVNSLEDDLKTMRSKTKTNNKTNKNIMKHRQERQKSISVRIFEYFHVWFNGWTLVALGLFKLFLNWWFPQPVFGGRSFANNYPIHSHSARISPPFCGCYAYYAFLCDWCQDWPISAGLGGSFLAHWKLPGKFLLLCSNRSGCT